MFSVFSYTALITLLEFCFCTQHYGDGATDDDVDEDGDGDGATDDDGDDDDDDDDDDDGDDSNGAAADNNGVDADDKDIDDVNVVNLPPCIGKRNDGCGRFCGDTHNNQTDHWEGGW